MRGQIIRQKRETNYKVFFRVFDFTNTGNGLNTAHKLMVHNLLLLIITYPSLTHARSLQTKQAVNNLGNEYQNQGHTVSHEVSDWGSVCVCRVGALQNR